MSTTTSSRPALEPPVTHYEGPVLALGRLLVRQVALGAVVVSGVCAAMVAAAAAGYGAVGAGEFDALADSPSMRALLGVPWDLSTTGGFVFWRSQTVLIVVTGLWALLAATRLLRGDEEKGLWELMLAGTLTRRQSLASVSLVLGGAAVLVTVATSGSLLLNGLPVTGSLLYGVGLGLTTAVCAGLGGVSAQLFAQRRRAAGVASAVFGVFFVLRMVADAVESLGWLRWLTPFGWLENTRAFELDRAWPLLLLAALAAALAGATAWLADRRDLGAGVLPSHDVAAPRTRLLVSPLGWHTRQRIGSLGGWGATLFALALMYGLVAGQFGEFIADNADFLRVLEQLGMAELVTVKGFVATMASLLSVVVAAFAITVVNSDGEDEVAGRLDLVYSGTVTRRSWFGSLVVTIAVTQLVLTLVVALGLWLGSSVVDAGVSAGDALSGALNTLPASLLILGVAALMLGARAGLVVPVAGGFLGAAYLVELFGPAFGWPEWVLRLSPYDHLAAVPAMPANTGVAVVLCVLAVLTALAGFVLYRRRDL